MRRTDRKQKRSKHANPSGMLTEATGIHVFQHVSPAPATCAQPHLRDAHEDIPAPLGIDAETYPEETHRCLSNLRLGPCFPPSAMFPEETMSGVANTLLNGSKFSDGNRQPPSPSSRMMKEGCPDAARSSASFTAEAFKSTSSRADRNPTASSKSAMLKRPRWDTSAYVASFTIHEEQHGFFSCLCFAVKVARMAPHQTTLMWNPGWTSPKSFISHPRVDCASKGSPCQPGHPQGVTPRPEVGKKWDRTCQAFLLPQSVKSWDAPKRPPGFSVSWRWDSSPGVW